VENLRREGKRKKCVREREIRARSVCLKVREKMNSENSSNFYIPSTRAVFFNLFQVTEPFKNY
jgi:hypothetical protein